MRALKRFRSTINETREPETMTAKELDKLLSRFFKDITKENGEEYEPSSLTSIQRSFQRYFSEKKLPFNIFDLDDSVKVPSASNIQNAVTSVSSSYPSASNALEAIFAGAVTFHLYWTAPFRL